MGLSDGVPGSGVPGSGVPGWEGLVQTGINIFVYIIYLFKVITIQHKGTFSPQITLIGITLIKVTLVSEGFYAAAAAAAAELVI